MVGNNLIYRSFTAVVYRTDGQESSVLWIRFYPINGDTDDLAIFVKIDHRFAVEAGDYIGIDFPHVEPDKQTSEITCINLPDEARLLSLLG